MALTNKVKCCDHNVPLWRDCHHCMVMDDTLERLKDDTQFRMWMMNDLGFSPLQLRMVGLAQPECPWGEVINESTGS